MPNPSPAERDAALAVAAGDEAADGREQHRRDGEQRAERGASLPLARVISVQKMTTTPHTPSTPPTTKRRLSAAPKRSAAPIPERSGDAE
jgi:hypothetical protein